MSKTICAFLASACVASQCFAQRTTPTPTPTTNTGIPDRGENPQDILPNTANKRLVIAKLKTLQSKQTTLIGEIDQKVKAKLKDTQEVKMGEDTVTTDIRMNKLQDSMQDLEKRRREALERSLFIDRLVFAIDTKWNQNSLKVFLEQSLLDIAAAEINQTDSKMPSTLWKFATNLSVAIRELPEPREDLIAFIDNFMDFSTILEPKAPTAFAQARSYTNGVTSESARTAKQEDLGDGVERKLKAIGAADEDTAVIQGTTSAPLEPTPSPRQPMSLPNSEKR